MTTDFESDLSGAVKRFTPLRKWWQKPFPDVAPGARVVHKLTGQAYVVVARYMGVATLQYLVETPWAHSETPKSERQVNSLATKAKARSCHGAVQLREEGNSPVICNLSVIGGFFGGWT